MAMLNVYQLQKYKADQDVFVSEIALRVLSYNSLYHDVKIKTNSLYNKDSNCFYLVGFRELGGIRGFIYPGLSTNDLHRVKGSNVKTWS